MKIEDCVGQPKTLSEWARQCVDHPGTGSWLLYEDQFDSALKLETPMFPITADTGSMSDDEYEAFENMIDKSHYSRFLNLDQLEDIITNLSMQRQHYSDRELMSAIAFYMDHDAFIVLNNG